MSSLSELKGTASRLTSSFQNSNPKQQTIKERKAKSGGGRRGYDVVKTNYTSLPVALPEDFLKPLENPEEKITVRRIEFEKTVLSEYRGAYAVVLDGVLSREECGELIRLAEMSKGGHGNLVGGGGGDGDGGENEDELQGPENNGWTPAMVNAGVGYEFLSTEYRNSDRIIWDEKEVVSRFWKRVLQGKGIKEDIGVLEGKRWERLASLGLRSGERWSMSMAPTETQMVANVLSLQFISTLMIRRKNSRKILICLNFQRIQRCSEEELRRSIRGI
ncbi:hypothetical protein EAE96_004643 [Botrytis aclada]|nr:hypothetical protein EAE96_004643 [Botrytis aclada]